MYIFHEHARKMNLQGVFRKYTLQGATFAGGMLHLQHCAVLQHASHAGTFWGIFGNYRRNREGGPAATMFLNICGNFERVGVPVAGGGGFLGGTPSIREKPRHTSEPHHHATRCRPPATTAGHDNLQLLLDTLAST